MESSAQDIVSNFPPAMEFVEIEQSSTDSNNILFNQSYTYNGTLNQTNRTRPTEFFPLDHADEDSICQEDTTALVNYVPSSTDKKGPNIEDSRRMYLRTLKPKRLKKCFQCKVCSRKFSLKNNLRKHQAMHCWKGPLQCNLCSRTFPDKRSLETHLVSHSMGRPYQCELCSKTFKRKGDASKHQQIHYMEKQFECKICSKKFLRKYNLGVHEKSHTGDKPYECKFCHKHFTRKYNLKNHKEKSCRYMDDLM